MKQVKKLVSLFLVLCLLATTVAFAACNSEDTEQPGECQHSFVNGKCTKCGAKEPGSVAERQVTTYIDESFDHLNIGDSVEDNTNAFEYYEGGGFIASSKDADGNVWIRAKDVASGSQWALAYTNIYKNNVKKVLKDFCVQFDTRLPVEAELTSDADGGACILWSPQAGRYDLAVHFNKASNGEGRNEINLWHAMNTDGGPFATTQHNETWGERGSLIEDFSFTPGVSYSISICGKHQGIDADGNEFFTLYVFVDDQLVIYQRDVVYWEGGFGLRGFISPYEYANFKVSDFPLVCPDGIDHYSVDTAGTQYNLLTPEKLPAPTPVNDQNANKVTWQAVEGACGYNVYMGDDFITYTTAAEFSYADYYTDGTSIYVVACPGSIKKHASDKGSTDFSHAATPLAAPVITEEEGVISWAAVENAIKYAIYCNGVRMTEQTGLKFYPSFDEAGTYEITVKAISGASAFTDSAASNVVLVEYDGVLRITNAKIEGNIVSWVGDTRATHYILTVNGGEEFTVTETSYTLPSEGDYAVTIRACDSTGKFKNSSAVIVYSGPTMTLPAPSLRYIDRKIVWDAVDGATKYLIYRNGVFYTEVMEGTEYTPDTNGAFAVMAVSTSVLVENSDLSSEIVTVPAPRSGYFFKDDADTADRTASQEVGDIAQIGWNAYNAAFVIREIIGDDRFFGRSLTDGAVNIDGFLETWMQCKLENVAPFSDLENWTYTVSIKPIGKKEGATGTFIQLGFGANATQYHVLINFTADNGGAVEIYAQCGDDANKVVAKSFDADFGGTLKLNADNGLAIDKVSKVTVSHAKLADGKGHLTVFVDDVCVIDSVIGKAAAGNFSVALDDGIDALFGRMDYTTLAAGPDGTYTGAPITLEQPEAYLSENILSWAPVDYAYGYELYLDGSLYRKLSATETSYETDGVTGTFTIRAIGNGTTILASEFADVTIGAPKTERVVFNTENTVKNQDVGDVADFGWNAVDGGAKFTVVQKDADATWFGSDDVSQLRASYFPGSADMTDWTWTTKVRYKEGTGCIQLLFGANDNTTAFIIWGNGGYQLFKGEALESGATKAIASEEITLKITHESLKSGGSKVTVYIDNTEVTNHVFNTHVSGNFGYLVDGGVDVWFANCIVTEYK